jgi:hypothetical protein
MFLLFNPYAPTAPSHTLPLGWFAPGQGLLTYRTGWDAQASLFGAHVPAQQTFVDHQVSYFGDFQLYRRGSWAITHPLGYGGPPILGEGTNIVLHSGFGAMAEFREVVGVDFDPEGAFAYLAGTTGGQKYANGYYQPPPTYVHEWTRSIVYLPTPDRSSDTIIVFDRTNAQDPRDLPKFERYSATDRDTMNRSAVKDWILHTPVKPTFSRDQLSWELASGDLATLEMLLPRRRSIVVVDERQIWPDATMMPDQRKWHVRVAPEIKQGWDTFLNVIQIRGVETTVNAQLVENEGAQVQGALIDRQGASHALVLFNALPGPLLTALPNGNGFYDEAHTHILRTARLRNTGFSVTFSASSSTDVFIADLDPSRPWNIRVDGLRAVPLGVQTSSLARVQIPGIGSHTITVY